MPKILFLSMFIALTARAQTMYVSDFQNISLRQGPGVNYPTLKMLGTDTRVNVMQSDGEWGKVRAEDGSEGWVMQKVLSAETPVRTRLLRVENRFKEVQEASRVAQKEVDSIKKERDQALLLASTREKEIEALKKELQEINKASGNVRELQKDYKQATLQLNDYFVKNQQLESKVNDQYLWWFLAGAGVLGLGLFLGRVFKRTGYSSSLRF